MGATTGDANWDGGCDVWPIGGDGVIGLGDISVFIDQYLKESAVDGDIAPQPIGDRIVNFLDFAVLAENWLAGFE